MIKTEKNAAPKKASRTENAVRRAIGWLAEAGFTIAPATKAGGNVTEYAITDPYGKTVRLPPAGILKWHRIAG
jgi:hypothetical protein